MRSHAALRSQLVGGRRWGELVHLAATHRDILSVLEQAWPHNELQRSDGAGARSLRRGLGALICGAALGPFIGVSLSLMSVQLLPAGVASALMSLVPALLVPFSSLVFRERVQLREVLGTAVALAGVGLLSL